MSCKLDVQCEETKPGDVVCCAGGSPLLGDWDVSKALVLSGDDFPSWTVDLPSTVPAGTEFKFVIRSADGGVRWEPFDGNRRWPEPEDDDDDVVVSTTFGECYENLVEVPAMRHTRKIRGKDSCLATKNQNQAFHADFKVDHRAFIFDNRGMVEEVYEADAAELGAGAFGSVRRAAHKETKECLAMKSIAKQRLGDVEKFKEEVEIMKMMDHPNIVKLFEFFEDEKYCYMIMELSDGGDLFDRIVQEAHFSEVHAQIMMRQIFSGVLYLHGKNVMHRDIKPENFLFSRKGPLEQSTMKIIDFGLSAILKPGQACKSMVGTPNYCAPEVLGGSYGAKADLWSCGVVLYVMLSGQNAFDGPTVKDIFRAVKAGHFCYDPSRWDCLSEQAKDLVDSLIKVSVDSRLSAEQALNHDWMGELSPKAQGVKALSPDVFKGLQAYQSDNALKKATKQLVAWRFMSEDRIAQLTAIFRSLDTTGDGCLSLDEIKAAFAKGGLDLPASTNLDKLLEVADADGSGMIDYAEFIAVTVSTGHLEEDVLHSAFKLFDKDGDGRIDLQELKQVLQPDNTQHDSAFEGRMKLLITSVEDDGDGKIDFSEYCKMMRSSLMDVIGSSKRS